MSNLERESQHLLSGIIRDSAPISLLPRGIATLASFAFKNAIICSYGNSIREPFFTPAVRSRFRASLLIPDGIQMWVGEYGGDATFRRFAGMVVSPRNAQDATWNDIELYPFTYVAGRLVLQVLTLRWRDVRKRGIPLPTPIISDMWDEAAIRFWPPDGLPVSWPPPKYFDRQSIERFVNRWEGSFSLA